MSTEKSNIFLEYMFAFFIGLWYDRFIKAKPKRHNAVILRTAGICQSVQGKNMAGGLSLLHMAANLFDVQYKMI